MKITQSVSKVIKKILVLFTGSWNCLRNKNKRFPWKLKILLFFAAIPLIGLILLLGILPVSQEQYKDEHLHIDVFCDDYIELSGELYLGDNGEGHFFIKPILQDELISCTEIDFGGVIDKLPKILKAYAYVPASDEAESAFSGSRCANEKRKLSIPMVVQNDGGVEYDISLPDNSYEAVYCLGVDFEVPAATLDFSTKLLNVEYSTVVNKANEFARFVPEFVLTVDRKFMVNKSYPVADTTRANADTIEYSWHSNSAPSEHGFVIIEYEDYGKNKLKELVVIALSSLLGAMLGIFISELIAHQWNDQSNT